MRFSKIFNRRGNIITLEFVIIVVILTFFIFFPFALYSAYQTRDDLADIKDRGLQLVATTGEVTPIIIDSLKKEFEFYNLIPDKNQRIIMIFYNVTKDNGEFNEQNLNAGKKTVVEFTVDNNGKLISKIIHDNMTKAYRKDNDIIRMTIEYPLDNFLNSTLKLIGKKLTNNNNTGANLAIKTSGFIMSEYKE